MQVCEIGSTRSRSTGAREQRLASHERDADSVDQQSRIDVGAHIRLDEIAAVVAKVFRLLVWISRKSALDRGTDTIRNDVVGMPTVDARHQRHRASVPRIEIAATTRSPA